MNSNYWKQKAAPWVTFSVLAGGLISAVLLLMVNKVDKDREATPLIPSYLESDFK